MVIYLRIIDRRVSVANDPRGLYYPSLMGSEHIRVAAGQLTARLMNEADATLASIEAAVEAAASAGARLLVLPECAYPAYILGSVESYRAAAHLSSEAFVEWLAKRAARHRLHIVCGFVEDTGAVLHNTAVLLDEQGQEIGRTRKRFLWHADHDWFAPGDDIRAFDTALGRIGIVICSEARVPEIVATLAADGAELIAMPTCWINTARTPGQYENPQVSFLIEARTREFGMPFICADKAGLEMPGMGYVGLSRIVNADGSVAAEAPPAGDAVITAELTPRRPPRVWASPARRARLLSEKPLDLHPVAQDSTITIAAVATSVVDRQFTGALGENLFEPLRAQSVNLLMANVKHETPAERLVQAAHAFDIKAVAFPLRPQVFNLGPARVGCLSAQAIRSFVAARALTLDGAEILFVFDVPDDIPLLRTRAVENRVFVVGASDDMAIILGPDGSILARAYQDTPAEAVARIDLAEAHDKRVTPRTDIFAERRASRYHF